MIAAGAAGGNDGAEKADAKFGAPLLFGSFVTTLVLGVAGALPGTSKPKG